MSFEEPNALFKMSRKDMLIVVIIFLAASLVLTVWATDHVRADPPVDQITFYGAQD